MLTLERHNCAKVFQPEEGRFSSMPGKVYRRTGRSAYVLDDVCFKDVVRHGLRRVFLIEILLPHVITIAAGHVAGGADRFGEDLEFSGSFGHH